MNCRGKYFVYIMTNASRTLYVGVTNNLARRVSEHKSKSIAGFTRTYNITTLIYFEEFSDIRYTIAREKQIKSWRRQKKLALIESNLGRNPTLNAAVDSPEGMPSALTPPGMTTQSWLA